MNALLLGLLLIANPAAVTEPAGVPAIDTVELAERMRKDSNLLIVDLRPADAYADGHLPFAVNLPWEAAKSAARLETMLKGGPRAVVLYGADALTLTSVAQKASVWNGEPVAVYQAGVEGWADYEGGFLEMEWPGLWRLLTKGTPVVLDVRGRDEFAAGHIPGARHYPPEFVGEESFRKPLAGVEKLQVIVTYCGGELCGESRRLAAQLSKSGYTHVYQFPGGYPEWEEKTASLKD